jgi:hypothetical protein
MNYLMPSKFSSLSGLVLSEAEAAEGSGARGVHDAKFDDGVEVFDCGGTLDFSLHGWMTGFA